MAYNTNIAAIEPQPIAELYEFSTVKTIQRYTSYPIDLGLNGYTYKAAPIKRTAIAHDLDSGVSRISVSAPLIDSLISYIANVPVDSVSITIYRAFTDDLTDYKVIFSGTIKRISLKDRVASAQCESANIILNRMIPNIFYQSLCNHRVFDEKCGLIESNYKTSAVVTVSGSTLVSATFSGFSAGYFSLGYVKYDDNYRYITKHDGNTLYIHLPFQGLTDGDTVKAYPGCDGSPATCTTKFSNFDKFLGMPYIPSRNPVMWGM